MRHPQWVGMGVIGVAVVLVAVVTGLQTHLVAGAAQAAPVLGPPAGGDCVLDPLPDPALEVSSPVTATSSGGTVPVYPVQQIRPCTAARYGEIVSVTATPKPTVVKGDGDQRYVDDPNADSCFFAAYQYLGMTLKPVLGFWNPYLQFAIALSRPSPRQVASGQHWAACIVTLQPPQNVTTDQPPALRYGASLRDALRTGQQRDQLGACLQALNWDDGFTSGGCRQRHDLELLASGTNGDHPTTRDQVQSTCQQLVRQLTAMADPTAAGALSIQINIESTNNNTPITTQQIPAHSNLSCGIAATGNHKLGGSLLALGRQPIPWA